MRLRLTTLLLAGLLVTSAARATDFRIDATRSHAVFSVRLLWLHTINGRFTQIAGTVKVDPQGLSTVDASIAVDSIAMESERFRRWVLAPEFFDAARYPTIRFLSDPVPYARLSSGGVLNGQLTLRGVTRAVRFELLPAGCSPANTQNCLIEARGSISRSAFGMSGRRGTLSDQVQLGLVIALAAAPN